MKNILYIGNNLGSKKTNLSGIQVLGELLEKEGNRVLFASSKTNKLLRLLDMIIAFFKYYRNIDFVFIDTYSTCNFYYALIISQLCRIFRVQYIPLLHGGNLPFRLKRDTIKSNLIFKNSYRNVTPSLYLKYAFENYGYSNLVFIPNTLEIKNYKLKQKKYTPIKLLWVRSFSEIYNPSMAVKVLKGLLDRGYQSELCMVGPDSDGSLKKVKKLAKQLQVEVTFTGKLSKQEWIKLSESYNIFINTTNFDNMPVSVIEAMALGLPIVSTNVGGMPYLIEDGVDGLLVEKDNVNAMVDAIINTVENEHSTFDRALNARKKVEAYDWEIIKHKWYEILK